MTGHRTATTTKRLARPPALAPVEIPLDKLASEIIRIIDAEDVSAMDIFFRTRVVPTQLSRMKRHHGSGMTLEFLVRTLTRLGCDVEFRVHKTRGSRAGRVHLARS